MLAAILPNNERMTLKAIQSSSELLLPSQAQSGRVKGHGGFKGGVTSPCRTVEHATWQCLTSRVPLHTLQPHGLLSIQEWCWHALVQCRPPCPPPPSTHTHQTAQVASSGVHVVPSLLACRLQSSWAMLLLRFQRMGPHGATDWELQPKRVKGPMQRATPGPCCWTWRTEHQVQRITYDPCDLIEFAL